MLKQKRLLTLKLEQTLKTVANTKTDAYTCSDANLDANTDANISVPLLASDWVSIRVRRHRVVANQRQIEAILGSARHFQLSISTKV